MIGVALKILWADIGKAIAMVLGVAFSTLLMAQQAAIFVCLMGNSASHITAAEDVDIWVSDPRADYFDDPGSTPLALVERIRSMRGVAFAAPFVYSGVALDEATLVETGLLIALDANSLLGAPQKMALGSMKDLRAADTFMVDRRGYGDIWPKEEFRIGRTLEVDGRRLTLVGIVDPPSPFISTPLIYTSMTTAALIRPGIAPTFVVVRANDGVDAGALAQEISKASGYAAFPSDMFKELTIDYYLKNTGIPINFFITITLGFIVGAAIVAQTFYLFVTENLKHLSVFKAMGAKAPQLLSMTAIQCAVVTATGFSIGAAGAAWFFESVPDKVPAFKGFYLPFGVLAKTFLAVTGVALLSGFLSIQRALRIDPAEVLRA